MKFMNQIEIEEALSRHSDPAKVKHWAAVILSGHMHAVNANSDGWAYWAPPVVAAGKLIDLLADTTTDETVLATRLRSAVVPLKRFYTMHADKMTWDTQAVKDARERLTAEYLRIATGAQPTGKRDIATKCQICGQVGFGPCGCGNQSQVLPSGPVAQCALHQIHKLLDGKEWSPATLDAIADELRAVGYAIREETQS